MKLHDYQQAGVAHLLANSRAGLFMDMGLGKTATALTALTPAHLPALVVAPKRVAETVWTAEGRLWRPDLTVEVAAGGPAARMRALRNGADVVVIGRDNLADATAFAPRWNTFILDELSGFKSRSSIRWRQAKKLCRIVPTVWGLTGTPSPNGLLDLWAQMYLLDEGKRLEKTLTGYRNRYFIPGRRLPNGIVTEWIPREETEEAVHRLIDDICLSMATDGRIELPPTTYNIVEVPMLPKVKSIYRTLKKDALVDLGVLGEVHTAPTAAALSNRLSQISAGFIYVDKDEQHVGREGQYDILHWEKVRAVEEIIDGTGSPVLVFYRYRAELEMLLKKIDGARTIDEKGVIEDWNAGKVSVLIAHPASAGHGLNLQHGGHTIVWASLPWSLEEWEQANKRLSRQGQQNHVIIHVLTTPYTVDVAIKKALDGKQSIQRALLEHLESPI